MRKEILVFSLILIICLIVSKFVFSFAFVHGDSMSPTFSDKQLIFINKIDRNYNNYDIIIFNKNDRKLIKRVVAVPGDKIVIKDNCLYVNDKYYENINIEWFHFNQKDYQLKEEEYFVLGDNLSNSIDSRYNEVGLVYNNEIIGKVICWLF